MTIDVIFKDEFGTERSTMMSNGKEITLTLRDIPFSGSHFDGLEPTSNEAKVKAKELFNLNSYTSNDCEYNELDKCSFELKFPVRIKNNSSIHNHLVNCTVLIDSSDIYINQPIHSVKFQIDNNKIEFDSTADFESLMNRINSALKDDYQLICCMACRLSCYSRYGNDWFGTLTCLKNLQSNDDYLKIAYDGLVGITEKQTKLIERTQEFFYCQEFEPMKSIDNHNKDWNKK